jgi:hypothetical protein
LWLQQDIFRTAPKIYYKEPSEEGRIYNIYYIACLRGVDYFIQAIDGYTEFQPVSQTRLGARPCMLRNTVEEFEYAQKATIDTPSP